jgi:hypothetical protein
MVAKNLIKERAMSFMAGTIFLKKDYKIKVQAAYNVPTFNPTPDTAETAP